MESSRRETFRQKLHDQMLQIGVSIHSSVEILEIATARGVDFPVCQGEVRHLLEPTIPTGRVRIT